MKTAIAFLLLTLTANAGEMTVRKNVPYAKPINLRQLLDIYAPAASKEKRPILVWIHGGAWRFGNKWSVQEKPQALVDKGFVFVSINYRFVPTVTMDEIAADVAKAIAWVHGHAADFGCDPNCIFVAGHSAGAHLAALVSTDSRYLKAEGLTLANLKGCIPVDTAMYNAAAQISSMREGQGRLYTTAFTTEPATQRKYSPITYVAPNKNIPPMLLLHVASRADSTTQTQQFAKALQAAGVTVTVVAGENKTHATINTELGTPNDTPTQALFEFLDTQLGTR